MLLADFLKNSSNFLTSSGLISNPPVRAHTAPSNPTMAASVKTLYHVAMVSVVDQRVFYLIISTNFTFYQNIFGPEAVEQMKLLIDPRYSGF